MLDPGVLNFVTEGLPPAPARVLEVGAGNGELAHALGSAGYEVVAIDPASEVDSVRPVALHELDGDPGSFDAAVAVMSRHHVEPLAESCERLSQLVHGGATLVLDELDVERFDERAAEWWFDHHEVSEDRFGAPGEILEYLRHHCHPLRVVLGELDRWFELEQPARGPYLHRWQLPPELRETEEQLIASGDLPATGARVVGVRRY